MYKICKYAYLRSLNAYIIYVYTRIVKKIIGIYIFKYKPAHDSSRHFMRLPQRKYRVQAASGLVPGIRYDFPALSEKAL